MEPSDPTVVAVPVDYREPSKAKKPWHFHLIGTPSRRCIFSLCLFGVIAMAILFGLLFGLVRNEPTMSTKDEEPRYSRSTPPAVPTPKPSSCIGKEGSYRYAAVASDAEICSTIGSDILAKKGGSAVDAAIATLLCLGLANIHSMGIGGGFFMTLYDKQKGEVYTLDAREEAPAAATEDMYVNDKAASSFGGKSIAVPAEVAGYMEAHKFYGKVPWKELFEPSIKLCREGVPVTPGLVGAMKAKESVLRADKQLSGRFINPKTGDLYKLGEKIFYPKFAKTLQIIADEGGYAFYNGSLVENIVADIKDAGGIITMDDMANYKPKWRTPVSSTLNKKLRVYSLPPPSSGAILIYILNLLDGYNFTNADLKKEPVKTYQRIVESFKFAYARRAELGDQDFIDITTLLSNLTSSAYADYTRSFITDDRTHDPSYYGEAMGKTEKQGTSHLSVVAPNGDAISVTSTINLYFGSKVLGNRTDILFNDEMDDFSSPNMSNTFGLPPSPTNFIRPGKRPMSSMSPAIIVDDKGDVKLVIGASGGSKIISSVAYCSARALMFGETLKDAIDAARLHDQWVPNKIIYDPSFSKEILDALQNIGHEVEELKGRGAVLQGVYRTASRLNAYSDQRKGGCTDGY
ncbi:glutathione hydrolase 1 proenzyme-like [Lineus longissimus]|uniref:glutathione hydrolase 1 proenzyme-like n=1 Tax=Lineus longissimus TaxID=88925 RepID=UPI002B4D434A